MLVGCGPESTKLDPQLTSSARFSNGLAIDAPRGSCIDNEQIKQKRDAFFVVIVPCRKSILPQRRDVVTVSFFATPSKTVKDMSDEIGENIKFYSRVVDQSARLDKMGDTVWQAVRVRQDGVTIVSLYSEHKSALAGVKAKAKLNEVLKEVWRE